MIYYRFHEADGQTIAISNSKTGSNLPTPLSMWRADGQTDVSAGGRTRLGSTPDEIIDAIERDGYFLVSFPPT